MNNLYDLSHGKHTNTLTSALMEDSQFPKYIRRQNSSKDRICATTEEIRIEINQRLYTEKLIRIQMFTLVSSADYITGDCQWS